MRPYVRRACLYESVQVKRLIDRKKCTFEIIQHFVQIHMRESVGPYDACKQALLGPRGLIKYLPHEIIFHGEFLGKATVLTKTPPLQAHNFAAAFYQTHSRQKLCH